MTNDKKLIFEKLPYWSVTSSKTKLDKLHNKYSEMESEELQKYTNMAYEQLVVMSYRGSVGLMNDVYCASYTYAKEILQPYRDYYEIYVLSSKSQSFENWFTELDLYSVRKWVSAHLYNEGPLFEQKLYERHKTLQYEKNLKEYNYYSDMNSESLPNE